MVTADARVTRPVGLPGLVTTVVVLGRDRSSTRSVVHGLMTAGIPVTRVILERREPRLAFLRRRERRYGLDTVIGQLLFLGAVVPVLRLVSRERRRRLGVMSGLNDGPLDEELVARVPSANDPGTIDVLRTLAPRVVVINGTRILSRDVLTAVPATFLNLHAGITPGYRGAHGGYWALADGHPDRCGVTVHVVDPGIDTGAVVDQATIEPTDADDFTTYPLLQLAAGLPMLVRAVRDALDGTIATRPAPEMPSRTWTHPTAWGYLWRRIRRGIR
jgi:hypothetical protein